MSIVQDKATEVLLNLITKAANGLDAAVAFSKEQIPDVVAQLLMWNLVSSALLCLLAILLIVVPPIILCCLFKQLNNKAPWTINERYHDSSGTFDVAVAIALTVGGVSVIFGCVMFFNNFDWLKILIAPKLYLLEYAAYLIKG